MARHHTGAAAQRRWGRAGIAGAVVLLGAAAQVRQRAAALAVLSPSDDEVDPDHLFLTARGVSLDPALRRAASAYARSEGLDVLDLVPPDLEVERAIEVLRWTDPASFRNDRLAFSRGGAHALLVSRDVAARAQLDVRLDLDAGALALAGETAKKFAPLTSDLALAPGLRGVPLEPGEQARLIRAVLDFAARPYLTIEAFFCGLMGMGAVAALRRRQWRLALPLLAYSLQPVVAFAGTALRPADLAAGTAGRGPRRLLQLFGTGRELAAQGYNVERIEELREIYAKLLADGTDRFFGPRQTDCWFCGGTDLSVAVDTGELLQCKPGHFVLERCEDCGHVFQNPRLTSEGLDFYYRDYYDGLGERPIELLFGTQTKTFRARAEMLRDLGDPPRRWIDVGGDRGGFCLVAAESWPDTVFDGLDMSDGIEEGVRRGWISRGHRGQLVDLADDLAGQYDVVSMCHYLEHTVDPRAELDAVRTMLRPDGHVLVEVPDPEFPLARLLKSWWGSYVPAQHLHFLTIGNLEKLLAGRGFDVVRRERGKAHVLGADFAWAVYLVLQKLAPPTHFPWQPPATRMAKLRRSIGFAVASPLLVVALAGDLLLSLIARLTDRSNAYRVVARKTP